MSFIKYLEKMAQELKVLAQDAENLAAKKKEELKTGEKQKTTMNTIMPVTKFYKSNVSKEDIKKDKENPITPIIDGLNNIFS